MSEAGRKILYTHFCRMVENEEGTRSGEDPEACTTSASPPAACAPPSSSLNPISLPEALAPFGKTLKLTGRALGAVRDLDVLMAKAEAFQSRQAEGSTDGPQPLAPLLSAWRRRRDAAREELLDYLDAEEVRQIQGALP